MRMQTTLLKLLGAAALVALLAGCGATSTATPAGSTTTTGGYNYPTATAAPAASSDLPLTTATATVKGAAKTILTTAGGATIYYRTSDSGTNVFVGATWPPVLSPNGTPTSKTSLPGTLGVLTDGNGAQATYNGHPLYLYAGDGKAGDTNGEGIGNVWFVVTPDLAKAATTSGGASTTPTPGGYGYGG